jgi:hypothetical protein
MEEIGPFRLWLFSRRHDRSEAESRTTFEL